MRKVTLFLWAAGICMFLLCPQVRADATEGPGPTGLRPSLRPQAILVSDFSLDAEAEKKGERGLGGRLQVRKRMRDIVDRAEENPEDKARRITNTLAESIVDELNKKNVRSRRISPREEPPSGNWLLEGEFVEYGEGDRLKRAVIGFGSGSASMEVRVRLSEVMDGGVRPIYDSTTGGSTRKTPGAVVTRNPYVAGAKYVLTKNAPDREVRKIGAGIADKLVEYMKGQGF